MIALAKSLIGLVLGPFKFLAALVVPKRRDLWLFSAWFGEKYQDSPRSLFEYLQAEPRHGVSAYWIYKTERPVAPGIDPQFFVRRGSLRGCLLQLRARVFVLCVNARDFDPFFLGPRSITVQTWHGTPMKAIGYPVLAKRHIARMKFWIRRWTIDNYDVVLSPSEYTDRAFCEAFQLPESRLFRTEYPRLADMFPSAERREEIRRSLCRESNATIWLYLPTHRSEGRDAKATRRGIEMLKSLSDRLSDAGVVVIYKPHFYEASLLGDIEDTDAVQRLADADGGSLYELMGAVDGLITDYSSVAYDYAAKSARIVIFGFDQEEFQRSHRELLRLPSEDFPVCVRDPEELLERLLSFDNEAEGSEAGEFESVLTDVVRYVARKAGIEDPCH